MAESLKRIKNRIKSVAGVEKLTGAMKMISASKLKSLQKQLFLSGEYFLKLEAMLKNILSAYPGVDNEFLRARPGGHKMVVCVFTSDTGLCGGYNNAVINCAERFMRANSEKDIALVTVGRKALRHFKKKGFNLINSYVDLYGRYQDAARDHIAGELTDIFLKRRADEVYLVYTSFISGSRHNTVVEKIFNIELPPPKEALYIAEPDAGGILEGIIPMYISGKIKHVMLNTFASEHAARVVAMSEAADNARELMDGLVLLRNNMRQVSITTEIIEVISSVDAMKG